MTRRQVDLLEARVAILEAKHLLDRIEREKRIDMETKSCVAQGIGAAIGAAFVLMNRGQREQGK